MVINKAGFELLITEVRAAGRYTKTVSFCNLFPRSWFIRETCRIYFFNLVTRRLKQYKNSPGNSDLHRYMVFCLNIKINHN
jgi:hypothetical protein